VHVDDVDLSELVDRILANIDVEEHTVDVDIPEDLPLIMTDRALLKRVMINVVGNAIRFSPRERPIRISACLSGPLVQILIIDRGPGIDEAQRATLIASSSELYEETTEAGIALTASAGFLRPLGGQLRFEDTPGGGLTVCVELLHDMTDRTT
jgi:two-component system sensor histidine kinase KdpD